jgi:hypothetical protein
MGQNLVQSIDIAVAAGFLGVVASAGELDPNQQNWFNHYKNQTSVPAPADMLLNTDVEPALDEGFTPLLNGTDLTGWTPDGGESPFEAADACCHSKRSSCNYASGCVGG